MPASFRIYPDLPLLVTRFSGSLTTCEFRGLYDGVRKAPDFSPIHPEVSDFRAVAHFDFGHEEMARLARQVSDHHWDTLIKTALLAEDSPSYDMARTYQSYAQLGQVETVELFEDPAAALAWVGLPGASADLLEFDLDAPPRRP